MMKSLNSKHVRSSWQLLFSFGILFMFGIIFLGGVEILLKQSKEYHIKEENILKSQKAEYLVLLRFRDEITEKEKQEKVRSFIALKSFLEKKRLYKLSIENNMAELNKGDELLFRVESDDRMNDTLRDNQVYHAFEEFFKSSLNPSNGILIFEYKPM
ncbi:hypothetical protein [Elizabethkingia anophelis]|uniref:hypothetical protein n=1 Tax=Elizabethkingia anophelis TaxID=1117645 RepID=UPI003207A663